MPNVLLEKYGMVHMAPSVRKEFMTSRQKLGISRIRSQLKNLDISKLPETSIRIEFKQTRNYNAIKMHPIEEVKISTTDREIRLEEIKSILSNGTQFKVCIVAP